MQQQTLAHMTLPDGLTFHSFYAGEENIDSTKLLEQFARQGSYQQMLLWGDKGSGKSHLLQAICHKSFEEGHQAAYLPLHSLIHYGARVLEGLEYKHILALDDVDLIVGFPEWEYALFTLINQARLLDQRIAFSASSNPMTMGWQLPDLSSRLLWGTILQIHPLTDQDKSEALRLRAKLRGFNLPDNVIDYINKRYPQDFDSLLTLLDHLDRSSFEAQRRITIPFVREVMTRKPMNDSK